MPEESDDSSLLSASDRAIFQYLDEMLSDPNEGSGQRSSATNSTFSQEPRQKPSQNSSQAKAKPQPASVATQTTPQTEPSAKRIQDKPVQRPIALKEQDNKVLTSSDTLLGFDKPIVVQQPATSEAPAKPVATKTATKTAVKPIIAATPELKPTPKPKATEKEAPPKTRLAEPPVAKAQPQIAVESEPLQPVKVEPVPVTEPVMEGDERLPPMTPWSDNGCPQWAQERFEVLLFKVAGLKLAVPLVTLGCIHQIEHKFHNLPGQQDWFIGILQTNLGNIKVLDTALCVMPEKYDADCRKDLNYVITLHGFEWGISCHEIMQSITLEPDDVKWRSQRGKRPWLAGTVVDQMCALIDTTGFHHVIRQVEKRNKQ